ncbi:MAG: MFS transporter [Planctomycetaceae bacterium]|jgi:FSR family fosmidomycin resistance protein-like MFS transporter|nr:MFS transporter [Planctomycetaceae bacterium]
MRTTALVIVFILTFTHLANDLFQAFFQAIYPQIKESLLLTFTQIGFITLTFQFTSSICQPIVGMITDKRPLPYLLPIGMTFTLIGVTMISFADSFAMVLVSVGFIGLGSAVFHPEASRIVLLVSGSRVGLFQSIFLVGGNVGGSFGALFAVIFIAPYGHGQTIWLSAFVICTIIALLPVCRWYSCNLNQLKIIRNKNNSDKNSDKNSDMNSDKNSDKKSDTKSDMNSSNNSILSSVPHVTSSIELSRAAVIGALIILMTLIFSKYVYLACFRNFYTFYLIECYGVTLQDAQIYLFLFLFAAAIGTLVGGPIGDRIGRKYVIWVSILGAFPFTVSVPLVDSLWGTCLLSITAAFILSSAFSAILMYAQELTPGKVGMVAGLFFGLAFGIAGIASAVLGKFADLYGINFVFEFCSLLPILGLATYLLPNIKPAK